MNNLANFDVIVVGGGPSGLMAAGTAAESGARILILEKNKQCGKKLSISGGGRCNITNDTLDPKEFLEKFPQAKKYLYSAFSQFAAKETFAFFEEKLKMPLSIQARGRTFPASEKATDVRDVMVKWCKDAGVEFATNSAVTGIEKSGESWLVKTAQNTYQTQKVVASTGGYAAPETGSTGDAFPWLTKLGHSITKPSPNIVPLETNAKWIHKLQGVSWDYLKLRFYCDNVQKINKTGKVLFTHFGISGPLVLNTSKEVSDLLSWGEVECSLDLFPDNNHGELDKRFVKLLQEKPKRMLVNTLGELFPKALAETVCQQTQTDVQHPSGEVSKEGRKKIVSFCKDLRFPITGTMGFDRAVIANGGVTPEEIDFKTMESKKCPGLYILGDLLDINRPSGGYGLQLCWTTGFVAGKNSATN